MRGIAWSADGKTMFFIDSITLSIDSFDYHDGELTNRKRMWTAPDSSFGTPDGMCIDSEDGLQELNELLDEAVLHEDYEKAAKIRDEISKR